MFGRHEGYDLSVYFNLYCWTKRSSSDAADLEAVLRDHLAGQLQSAVVDPTSIEVRARSAVIVKSSGPAHGLGDGLERRTDRQHNADADGAGTGNGLNSLFSSTPVDMVAGKKGIQLLSRPSSSSSVTPSPPPSSSSTCQAVSLNFCRNVLGYNFTSWPNLLGQRTVREIQRFNEAAK